VKGRDRILSLLQRDDVGLPALPEVLSRLDHLLRDPEVDIRKVADLAATDAVLAGQVVRMANSAYYARGGGAVTGLAPAIQRLGLRAVRGLVYALTLPRAFQANQFPSKLMWRHSLSVAALSQEIAVFLKLPQAAREAAWLGGLVHDIGALALSIVAPNEYGDLLKEAAGITEQWSESDFAALERKRLGVDHAEAGGIFLRERWRLPSPMPEIASHHHDLDLPADLPGPAGGSTIQIVHVANGICSQFGVDWNPCESGPRAFRESAWEALGLDLDQVEELVERTRVSLELAEALLSGGG